MISGGCPSHSSRHIIHLVDSVPVLPILRVLENDNAGLRVGGHDRESLRTSILSLSSAALLAAWWWAPLANLLEGARLLGLIF